MEVLNQLNEKFTENLSSFLPATATLRADIDLKTRALVHLGELISDRHDLQPSQVEISRVFNEVFADLVLAEYFTGCALDKPAHSVLRRALELGIATVYLWDLPHVFWGWKSHDLDLNFNDMLEYLHKEAYKTFLASINSKHSFEDLIDFSEARRLYRTLSDTIHGKISTHESSLTDRFKYSTIDSQINLEIISRVVDLLLHLLRNRFPDSFEIMTSKIPAVKKMIGSAQ